MQRYRVPETVPAALAKTYEVRTVNAIVKWLQLNPSDWDQELIDGLDKFIEVRAHDDAAQYVANSIGNGTHWIKRPCTKAQEC